MVKVNSIVNIDLQNVIERDLSLPKMEGMVKRCYKIIRESFIDKIVNFFACWILKNPSHSCLGVKNFNVQKLLRLQWYDPKANLSQAAQSLIYIACKGFEGDKVIDASLHNFGYEQLHTYVQNFPNLTAMILPNHKVDHALGGRITNKSAIDMAMSFTENRAAKVSIQHLDPRWRKQLAEAYNLGIRLIQYEPCQDVQEDLEEINALYHIAEEKKMTIRENHSEIFSAVSINPLDTKWKDKLVKAHRRGIRLIKWVPQQGMQPDSEEMEPFYRFAAKKKMTLIVGSIPAAAQDNPLHFRNALRAGVNIVLANCGQQQNLIPDLDDPYEKMVPGYKLFFRLAKEAYVNRFPGKLYGDLSKITSFGPNFVIELLRRSDNKYIRYLYSSDLPNTRNASDRDPYAEFAKIGLIEKGLVEPLKEIRRWNPLLANFVFTYNINLHLTTGRRISFKREVFTGNYGNAPLNLIDRDQWFNECKKREQMRYE